MIYVSSACICNEKICDTVEMFAQNNILNIELSGGTKYYDNIEKDLIRLKERYGINYVCHSYFPPPPKDFVVNLASCSKEIYNKSINHYLECIDMLCRVGINVLSIHSGFLFETRPENLGKKIIPYKIYGKESIEKFINAFQIIQEKCKKNNISLFLENNVISRQNFESFDRQNLFMMTDSENIIKILDCLNCNLLLDLAHLRVSCTALGLDFEKEKDILIPISRWFHISENNGVIDQHKVLEEGSVLSIAAKQVMRLGHNITLETNGSIEEIKKTIEDLER